VDGARPPPLSMSSRRPYTPRQQLGRGASVRSGRLALRRMAAVWPLVAAVFVAATLAATLLAAAPIYAGAAAQAGLEETLRAAPPAEAGIEVSQRVSAGEYGVASASVRRELDAALGAAAGELLRHAESDSFALEDGTRTVLAFYSGLEREGELVAGRWPRAANGELEAVLSVPAAQAAGLAVGDVVRLDATLAPRIVGVFEIRDPGAPTWWGEPLVLRGVRGRDVSTVGPLVVPERAFLDAAARFRASWRVVARPREVAVGELPALRARLAQLEQRLERPGPRSPITVGTGLGRLLTDAERSVAVARSGVAIPLVQLALLAGYGLVFAAGLLRRRREAETELLRARGADGRALAALAGLEAAAVCLPAALVAPRLASISLRVLGELGPTARLDLAPQADVLAHALAFVGAAACAGALVLPALRAPHEPGPARRRVVGFVERSGLDLALLAAAAVALWQLRRYGSPLLGGDEGGVRIDPLLVAAPAIGLVAGAILAARVVPPALRMLERAASAGRGPLLSLAARRLARAPAEYRPAALLLVLGLGIGTFAAAYGATWTKVQERRAELRAGSDLLVVPDRRTGSYPPEALAGAYLSVPGVLAATPLLRRPIRVGREEEAALVAVEPERLGTGDEGLPLDALRRERSALPGLPLSRDPRTLELPVSARLLPLAAVDPRLRGAGPLRPPGFGRFHAGPPGFDELAPQLFVVVRDAAGLLHRFGAGRVREGAQTLRAELAPRGRGVLPSYPLELVALELVLTVPSVAPRTLVLDLGPSPDGILARGGDWQAQAVPVGSPLTAAAAHVEPSRDSLRLVVDTGTTLLERPPMTVSLVPGRPTKRAPLPVVAGTGLLASIGGRVGDVVELDLAGAARPVRMVGAADGFPTVTEARGDSFLVADAATLSDAVYRAGGGVLEPEAWLLEAEAGREGAVARALKRPPLASSEVVGRASLTRSLTADPLALATRGALWLGFAAAALFAPAAFALAAAARRREHAFELAALQAVGVARRTLVLLQLVEGAVVVALATALGVAVGVLLSYLVLPSVAFTETGAPAVPPPVVRVPWTTVAALALGVAVILLATVALDARRTGRGSAAEVLRGGADA
jgi:hypothetical protein